MIQLWHDSYNDGYYHFKNDRDYCPDAWLYIVWSRRGPGKTYSALWEAYQEKRTILYMKRTNYDVEMICNDKGEMELNPFVPINRDKGTTITAKLIDKGIGGFYETNEDGEADGAPIMYVASLNAIKSLKGFELSMCDWIILDEFIPLPGEVVKKKEGDMLLSVYMTVMRDRLKRGKAAVKLILFANAEEISTAITRELEVIDDIAELNASGESHRFIESRGILLHHITEEEVPIREEEKVGIYQGMQGTAWWQKNYGGTFAKDFSNVVKLPMKRFRPLIHLIYKTHDIYIYIRDDGMYYMTDSKSKCPFTYNLDRDNEQKLFYNDRYYDLREACIDEKMKFKKYSYYDLIMHYKDFFEL